MNKALILPIVTLLAMVVKQSTGFEFTDEMMNQITDGVMSIIICAGIFTHPNKPSE